MSRQVTHLIVGLGKGGAETMLYQVLKYQTDPSINYKVISLGASHFFEQPINDLGIPVIEVNIRKRPLSSLAKVFHEIKGSDTLFCWMYHANLIGYYLGKLARVGKVIWSIHHSDLSKEHNSKNSLLVNKCCALISNYVDTIVFTGEIARQVHEGCGYCQNNSIVLANGCDCELFVPNMLGNYSVRSEFGIPKEKKIILSVTKDTSIKDIPSFIHAFGRMLQDDGNIAAVLCGAGVTEKNERIVALCQKEKISIGTDIYLIGLRQDIFRLLAGCDLYVLHSAGEAFPVTLVEAMSCGCVCVATDVGDVRRILDDDNWIVPAQNSEKLYSSMKRALDLSTEERQSISQRNRELAVKNYSIKETVKKYEELY